MDDRRTLIADSAIEVIARDGVRALTHRAVDAEAGLPAGSTSYYCRTRTQLLALTVERLVALLRGYVETCGIQQVEPSDPAALATALVEMESGLLEDYRAELLARSALVLELTDRLDTAELLAALLDPSDLGPALESAGIRHHEQACQDVLSTLEGLLWERLVGRLAGTGADHHRDRDLLEASLSRHAHRGGRGLIGRLR